MSRSSRRKAQAERRKRATIKAESKSFRLTAASSPVTIQAEDGEGAKLASFKGMAYTGAPMMLGGWWNPLIVDLDGVKVPSQHRPALRQHDDNQIVGHTTEVKIDGSGIAVAGSFSGEKQHTDKVTVPAKNGFQWQMSIGAEPVRTEFLESGASATVNGREVTGPMTISRETELKEVSFVPLGADGDTSAAVSASQRRSSMKAKDVLKYLRASGSLNAAKYSDESIDKMSDDEAKAALKDCMNAADDEDSSVVVDEKKADAARVASFQASIKAAGEDAVKAARQASIDESDRVTAIKAKMKQYDAADAEIEVAGKKVNLERHAIVAGLSVAQLDGHLLEHVRASRPSVGPHFYSPSDPVMSEAVLEAAVFDALRGQFKLFDSDFYKFGDDGKRRVSIQEEKRITAELNGRYTDQVRQAAHTRFKGRMGLQQLLTTIAASNGYRGPATFNDPTGWGEVANYLAASIKADASSVNAPNTLANVQNKFLLQGYMFTEQSYLDFCAVLPVKDLKPTKSVQLFGDFVFAPLNPAGEITHGKVGDNPYANQAALQAKMLTLELQYLINDDLGAFGQLPMMLGRGWGLRVNDLVYTKFLGPGTDEGGSTNFFAATHTVPGQSGNSNLATGAGSALSSDGLKAAKLLFDRQVDPAGQPLGVDAEILLYPPELDVPAIELMNAQFIIMAGLASTAAASKQPNTNIWKGRFKPVMSRYLSNAAYTGNSTTAHYLLANPGVCPVIQIAALNGQMTPTIQTAGQDWQFNMLGISMRGWGGIGVSMQNYRGGVKSNGV